MENNCELASYIDVGMQREMVFNNAPCVQVKIASAMMAYDYS